MNGDEYSTDPKKHPEIYETLTLLCEHKGLEPADVARAIDMQPGTFQRSITGNPTVKLLKRAATALGIKWMYLTLDPKEVPNWTRNNLIYYAPDSMAMHAHKLAVEFRNNKKTQAKRKYGVDVTDKSVLATQYPPHTMAEEVLDTNYMDVKPPTPPRHVNPAAWERVRADLSQGLPEHLVMTDKAVEAGFSYASYKSRDWSLEALADQGLICNKGQE